MRIILSILFFGWIIFALIIAIKTNKKYTELREKKIGIDEYRKQLKKLRQRHLSIGFIGLFVVLLVVLVLLIIHLR